MDQRDRTMGINWQPTRDIGSKHPARGVVKSQRSPNGLRKSTVLAHSLPKNDYWDNDGQCIDSALIWIAAAFLSPNMPVVKCINLLLRWNTRPQCHAPAVEACHQHELPIGPIPPHSGAFTKGKHNKLQDIRMSMKSYDFVILIDSADTAYKYIICI